MVDKNKYPEGYGLSFTANYKEKIKSVEADPTQPVAGEDLPETLCDECGEVITGFTTASGKAVSVSEIVKGTKEAYGKALCRVCSAKAKAAKLAEKMKEKSE